MEPDQVHLLQETYKLALDNNRMLRAQRRQAWIGRIITIVIYAAAIGVPIWFYLTYISGTVDRLLQATGMMQTQGQQAQSQFDSFKEAWQEFQTKFQNSNQTSSASDTAH